MQFTPGIYPIYKPKGPTSFNIIAQLRRLTGIKKIGHAGTLDPLAEGVLVVAIGREFTKTLDSLVMKDKEYIAKIKLGEISTTDDAEGEKAQFLRPRRISLGLIISNDEFLNNETAEQSLSKEKISECLKQFVGTIDQTPPIYSSIKINGTPAHRRVRRGQQVELKSRKVKIYSIEILDFEYPFLTIKVHCGKGVYIRSLARDIGEALGTGAYLAELKRTRVGEFTLDQAHILPPSQKQPKLNLENQTK